MPAIDSKNNVPALRRLLERSERPFPSFPQVDRYFPAAAVEHARQRIARSIERGDGPAVAVGGAGTGKSLLLQLLAAQFYEQFDIVLLACARVCTRRALLQAILFELGLPYQLRDEGQLRLSLLDHLLSAERCPTGLVMLVDEAQALSTELLDELRVLTNLVRLGAPRVRLVLAGGAAIEESLACPQLESLSQRLAARCYLNPFDRDETAQFIRAQIAAVGGQPDEIFTAAAGQAVFDATDGVPRLINQLCDHAMLLASSRGLARVEREIVEAAWADLQQLPGGWDRSSADEPREPRPSIVEFGRLPDEEVGLHQHAGPLEPDTDSTDLDLDDELSQLPIAVDATSTGPASSGSVDAPSRADVTTVPQAADTLAVARDPFDEHFDDEEVVLDDFAAWDSLFPPHTPRVENRREPHLATLVEAALGASAHSVKFEHVAFAENESNIAGVLAASAETPRYTFEEPPQATASDSLRVRASTLPPNPHASQSQRPSLRIAAVPDVSDTNRPVAHFDPELDTVPHEALAAGRFEFGSEDDQWTHAWSSPSTASSVGLAAAVQSVETAAPAAATWDPTPILVVEDDPAPSARTANPPVRREEYRNLFSRLRGI